MNAIKQNMIISFLLIFCFFAWGQYPAPYVVDSDTLHLYHFDGDADDSVASNPINLTLGNGAGFETSTAGFATALDTYQAGGDSPYAASASNPLAVSNFTGTDGAFTFEAIIRPDVALGSLPNHMQIICMDSNNGIETRGWHFRINTSGQLQFTKITGALEDFAIILPTTGDHAYAVDEWYHVAVTYNGLDNTADNLKLYWTKLYSGVSEVQLLGSFQMSTDLSASAVSNFCIGNEQRVAPTENFEGLIDEVRISSIERLPSDMLYYPDQNTLHYYHFDGGGDDAVQDDPLHLTLGNGATITESSTSGYGTALDVYDGVTGDGPYAGAATNPVAISNFVGNDGAFTFEAFIRPDIALGSQLDHMQIVCMDSNNGTSTRGWHFRINTLNQLQFTKITGTTEDFTIAVPTSGDHAYQVGQWYHVAVTYNGMAETSDNLKLYWTKMDSEATEAQLLGVFQMASDLDPAAVSNFCVGNERRPTGGTTENFEGLIDEVRISDIERPSSGLLYKLNVELSVVLQHPVNATVQAQETAVFDMVFSSATPPQVNWYKSAEPVDIQLLESDPKITITDSYNPNTQTYSSTLTVDRCEVPDSGTYYGNIRNLSAAQTVNSDTVILGVQGLRAHWTLDQADYTGTHYADIATGSNALVESNPTFVTGADGIANGAIQITPTSGWASLDGFDPAGFTGQFTISYWANWQEQSVASDDLLVDSENGDAISVEDALTANDTWQHICTVFDGTTAKLYLDGVFVESTDWLLAQDMTSEFYIGIDETGLQSFNGYLDDIRIYNFALDDIQVADLRYDFAGLRSCIYAYGDHCDWDGPNNVPDCRVDIHDLSEMAFHYLDFNSDIDVSGPSGQPDGIVNLYDFAELCSVWLDCGLHPDCN